MTYRPDIDGLRGIAVLLVVFYHFDLCLASGGFFGVDVFFVISGFLITSIVLGEINSGEFSILHFYERRIRRIFPALFSVLIVCTAVGVVLLLPPDFEKYGRSLIATVFFGPNIFFAGQKSYFNPDNDLSPLLHTWSLGVEEQFYFALPLFLMLLARFPTRLRPFCICLALVASACWCFTLVKVEPVRAFYLTPYRAWELLFGVFVAHVRPVMTGRRWLLEVLTLLGLCFIGVAAFSLPKQITLPGPFSLLPTIGAGLVIYAGACGSSIMSRILSFRPLVGIGLISYSLYLWHWPLLSFYTLTHGDTPSGAVRYLLLVASMGLAWGSWWWIECPFRAAASKYTQATIFLFGASSMLLLGGVGVCITMMRGLPFRTSSEINRIASVLAEDPMALNREGECFLSSERGDINAFKREVCLRRDPTRQNYLLIGDSHAAQYWNALQDGVREWNVMQATASKCKPVLHPEGASYCVDLMNYVLNEFVQHEPLEGVIVAARWRDSHVAGVLDTVDYLKKYARTVIVIGPGVEYRRPLPRLLIDQLAGREQNAVVKARHTEQIKFDEEFAAALEGKNVRYISPYKTLCSQGDCVVVDDEGVPLQHDYGHLSKDGALFLVRKWRQAGQLP